MPPIGYTQTHVFIKRKEPGEDGYHITENLITDSPSHYPTAPPADPPADPQTRIPTFHFDVLFEGSPAPSNIYAMSFKGSHHPSLSIFLTMLRIGHHELEEQHITRIYLWNKENWIMISVGVHEDEAWDIALSNMFKDVSSVRVKVKTVCGRLKEMYCSLIKRCIG